MKKYVDGFSNDKYLIPTKILSSFRDDMVLLNFLDNISIDFDDKLKFK
jgi:hypothetical protein